MSQHPYDEVITEDEVPSTNAVYVTVPQPAGNQQHSETKAAAPAGGAGEFSEELDPSETPASTAKPVQAVVKKPMNPKGLAQIIGAGVILAFVMILYLLSLIGLNAHWLDTEAYTKTAVVLSGPLSLATAVTAFLYGGQRGRNS